MPSSRRGFVLRHTHLSAVPGLAALRLHLAHEILPLWQATQEETGDPDAPPPYWAFAWGGGVALAMYLAGHPEVVVGRDVLDLATGSGLVAIAAARAGAASTTATDIDAFAEAAVALNARANGARVRFIHRDVLDDEPPDVDVILAGDTWYEASFAERVLGWLRSAAAKGSDVLVGDPGRRYLPADELELLARYDVRTTTELEDLELKQGSVYRLRPVDPATSRPDRRVR